MWNEEHLRQVIWKDVAKVVEGVEDFLEQMKIFNWSWQN